MTKLTGMAVLARNARSAEDEPRNPPWVRDEEILLLDLYLRHRPMSESDAHIGELSDLLRRLPLHPPEARAASFRNRNGIFMKLGNLRHIDPSYPGRGLGRTNQMARIVWGEFAGDAVRVHKAAQAIRNVAASSRLQRVLHIPQEDEQFAWEGRVLFRLHRTRERSPRLVLAKRRQAMRKAGRITCEVCGIDPSDYYGELGNAAIECHHVTPLILLRARTRTTLDDLALVCANCHRVLHRAKELLGLAELTERVNAVRGTPVH